MRQRHAPEMALRRHPPPPSRRAAPRAKVAAVRNRRHCPPAPAPISQVMAVNPPLGSQRERNKNSSNRGRSGDGGSSLVSFASWRRNRAEVWLPREAGQSSPGQRRPRLARSHKGRRQKHIPQSVSTSAALVLGRLGRRVPLFALARRQARHCFGPHPLPGMDRECADEMPARAHPWPGLALPDSFIQSHRSARPAARTPPVRFGQLENPARSDDENYRCHLASPPSGPGADATLQRHGLHAIRLE